MKARNKLLNLLAVYPLIIQKAMGIILKFESKLVKIPTPH